MNDESNIFKLRHRPIQAIWIVREFKILKISFAPVEEALTHPKGLRISPVIFYSGHWCASVDETRDAGVRQASEWLPDRHDRHPESRAPDRHTRPRPVELFRLPGHLSIRLLCHSRPCREVSLNPAKPWLQLANAYASYPRPQSFLKILIPGAVVQPWPEP